MKEVRLAHLMALLAILFLANATLVLGSDPFTTTGSMGTARLCHTATLLPNGKVLIAGGGDPSLGDISFSSAELYDPVTGTFSPTGSLGGARVYHTATLLPNGRVLIAGGYDGTSNISSAEVYDPATGTFSPTGSMGTARAGHTATLLPSGKVLIAAGSAVAYTTTNSAELYDPATGTFTPTGSLVTTRGGHMAVLLPNGKVLIVGGGNWTAVPFPTSAELYDPATETFTATGSMATGRVNSTATLLPSGKVLIAAGEGCCYPTLGSAELYDPATGTFSPTGNLGTARLAHTATLLLSGKVMIVGGNWGNSLASAELYDPIAGAFTAAGSMVTGRLNHTATLLASGKVLIAGGGSSSSWPNSLSSAELYWDIASVPPDHTPPVTTATPSLQPNASGWYSQAISVRLDAVDEIGGSGVKWIQFAVNGGALQTAVTNTTLVPISSNGITTLTYYATDNAGNVEAPKTLTIKIDTTPPTISGLPQPGCTLWPPNHKLVQVATVSAKAGLSGLSGFGVTGTSSEPENGSGDGDTAPDIVITGSGLAPRVIQLRAERAGGGPGRVYTLTATATSAASRTTTLSATCMVPSNQGK